MKSNSSYAWLKKPTALFTGSSTKKERTPPRADRGYSPPPVAPRPSSPARTSRQPATNFASPRSDDNSSSSRAGASSPSAWDKALKVRRTEAPQDSSSLCTKEALDELRREVKGLQEAFNTLKKEHTELRSDVRKGQGVAPGGSLNVDGVNAMKNKQVGASLGSARSRSPQGSPEHYPGPALPIAEREYQVPQPVGGAAVPDEGFLGGILETCGFAHNGKKALKDGSATTGPPAGQSHPQATRDIAMGAPTPSAPPRIGSRGMGGLPPAPSNFGSGPVNSSPLAMEQVGLSSSSTSLNRSVATIRAPSPHDREGPMEGRRDMRRADTVPAFARKDGQGSAMPAFGSDGSGGGQSLRQLGHEFSAAGAERQYSEESEGPHFGTRSVGSHQTSGFRPQNSKSIDMSAASQRQTWKSPQVGQPLVLPFPDHEEMDSEVFSPSSAARITSPALELQDTAPARSPVPPFRSPLPPPIDIAAATGGTSPNAPASSGAWPPSSTLDFPSGEYKH